MKEVVCLFNITEFCPKPWADLGFDVYSYDKGIPEERVENGITYRYWDADDAGALEYLLDNHPNPHFVCAFPPCTDLFVAGNGWRERKARENPNYLEDAMARIYLSRDYAEAVGAPYFIEQPISRAATLWRKPDFYFHPFEFGQYLPEDDEHPIWPELIPPRDAYPKKTSLFVGNGFVMPDKLPVKKLKEQITCAYWFKDLEEEKLFRSATPRGFAKAVAEFNVN